MSEGPETGPRHVPVPWDGSYYIMSPPVLPAGLMYEDEFATNAAYGVVDKALSAYYVEWAGVQNVPIASPTQSGLMPQGNGDSSFYYGGDCQLHSSAPLRGTHWFSGAGLPSYIPGAQPGDFYLDSTSGLYYQFS